MDLNDNRVRFKRLYFVLICTYWQPRAVLWLNHSGLRALVKSFGSQPTIANKAKCGTPKPKVTTTPTSSAHHAHVIHIFVYNASSNFIVLFYYSWPHSFACFCLFVFCLFVFVLLCWLIRCLGFRVCMFVDDFGQTVLNVLATVNMFVSELTQVCYPPPHHHIIPNSTS